MKIDLRNQRFFGTIPRMGEKEMSKIRSWDRWIASHEVEQVKKGLLKSPGTSGRQDDFHGIPVRVVVWPEGAPKQEDVPHAGEGVRRKGTFGEGYVVATGIPELYINKRWQLRVTITVGATKAMPIDDMERISPTPPRTYTEDEIRLVMASIEGPYQNIYDVLMKRLKKGSP